MNISSSWKIVELGEISGGYCTFLARVALTIDGETKTREVKGWARCGFIKPGASQDLDGSKLSNYLDGSSFSSWGGIQEHGGWSVCDKDGTFYGSPCADLKRVDVLTIKHGDNMGEKDVQIDITEFESVKKRLGAMSKEEKEKEKREMISLCANTIGDCDWSPDVEQPKADDVFQIIAMNPEEDVVVCGNYLGCGILLAWREDNGTYNYEYWPDLDDICRAIEHTRTFREKKLLETLGENSRGENPVKKTPADWIANLKGESSTAGADHRPAEKTPTQKNSKSLGPSA